MSVTNFKEAKGNLAFSQGLLDHIRGQNMAQPQAQMGAPGQTQAQPSPQPPIEQPQEAPAPTEDASQFLNIIESMVETDKMEEERRLKEIESKHETDLQTIKGKFQEMESKHESDLTTIKDRVLKLLKRGKRK